MPRLDDGGPGAGPIQYPSILQTLGLDYEQDWTSSTHDALRTVEYTVASRSTFGEIPEAQDFATVYTAAAHIYEATLRGIRDDLTAAAQALAQAGAEIRERDEASGDAFQTLQARWVDPDDFAASQQTQQAARDEAAVEGSAAQVRIAEAAPAPTDPVDPGADTGAGGTPASTPTGPSSGGATPSTPPSSSGMDVG
ncbi:hypothetical protein KMZ32_09635 [Phycicoccus sp. MAQZ13P-2]|uniref:hypothetical protein n=1 Tax=Phycicoccus mangrovi TaxID=2840470 RepID=UPI001C008194|nr:hypothetical protein [Phycicoccus mangrovi]MBT9255741.1 hypothetical protein [Phycicoccus mangrovi]MBT9274335.1 hypothetical protein [Phycicoccus mangrovi]